jgi:hypothetical protein
MTSVSSESTSEQRSNGIFTGAFRSHDCMLSASPSQGLRVRRIRYVESVPWLTEVHVSLIAGLQYIVRLVGVDSSGSNDSTLHW